MHGESTKNDGCSHFYRGSGERRRILETSARPPFFNSKFLPHLCHHTIKQTEPEWLVAQARKGSTKGKKNFEFRLVRKPIDENQLLLVGRSERDSFSGRGTGKVDMVDLTFSSFEKIKSKCSESAYYLVHLYPCLGECRV
jgi:hypothetical protein